MIAEFVRAAEGDDDDARFRAIDELVNVYGRLLDEIDFLHRLFGAAVARAD